MWAPICKYSISLHSFIPNRLPSESGKARQSLFATGNFKSATAIRWSLRLFNSLYSRVFDDLQSQVGEVLNGDEIVLYKDALKELTLSMINDTASISKYASDR